MAKLHLPVTDEHFRAIGRISVHLEYLHSEMNYWIWTLLDADQRIGQVVTAGASFKHTVRLLGALTAERFTETSDGETLTGILREAERLEDRRNEILHSTWGGGGDDPVRIKSRITKRKLHHDLNERLTAQQLDAVADEIEATTLNTQEFFLTVFGALTDGNQSSGATP